MGCCSCCKNEDVNTPKTNPCFYYRVTFKDIDIHNDHDPFGEGEIVLTLSVNIYSVTLPERSMGDVEGLYPINKSFNVSADPLGNNILNFHVTGVEKDYLFDDALDAANTSVTNPSNGQEVLIRSTDFVVFAYVSIMPCTNKIVKTAKIISHMKQKLNKKYHDTSEDVLLNQFQKIYHNTITSVNADYVTMHGLPIPDKILNEYCAH